MDEQQQVKLRRFYLSRAPIETLFELLDSCLKNNFDDENQKLIEKLTFNDDLAREYPLSFSFRKKFLKKLIEKIESSRFIVIDSIYKEYTDLLSKSEQEYNFIIFGLESKEIIIQQSNSLVTNGTTGLKCWEGGLQLFEQIYGNRKLFSGKKVLELGCGIGFTGIALCSLCDFDTYLFTDYHEKVLEFVKNNLVINGFNLKSNRDNEVSKFSKFFESMDDDTVKENESMYEIPRGFSGSFNRQGAMNLFKKEFSSFENQSINYSYDLNGKKIENSFSSPLNEFSLFEDNTILNKKSQEFDEKISNFNEKLVNFEEFLKDFEKKLNIFDENLGVHNQINFENKFHSKNNENSDKNVDVVKLDWTENDETIIAKLDLYKPDYIIGADLVYDPSLIDNLIRVIKLALATLDCGIIIVSTVRNEQTCKLFETQLHKMQNQIENICIQRTKLSSKLSKFQYLKVNQLFILYNIRNED